MQVGTLMNCGVPPLQRKKKRADPSGALMKTTTKESQTSYLIVITHQIRHLSLLSFPNHYFFLAIICNPFISIILFLLSSYTLTAARSHKRLPAARRSCSHPLPLPYPILPLFPKKKKKTNIHPEFQDSRRPISSSGRNWFRRLAVIEGYTR